MRRSWAASQVLTPEGDRPVSPHDIYLKTLYTLVKDRLEGRRDTELLWEAEMPDLADFQRVAVRQAIKILDTYNGVFIADVVGLGKTFIGTTLLKHYALYRGARPLVVCPASLVEMWEWFTEPSRSFPRPGPPFCSPPPLAPPAPGTSATRSNSGIPRTPPPSP